MVPLVTLSVRAESYWGVISTLVRRRKAGQPWQNQNVHRTLMQEPKLTDSKASIRFFGVTFLSLPKRFSVVYNDNLYFGFSPCPSPNSLQFSSEKSISMASLCLYT